LLKSEAYLKKIFAASPREAAFGAASLIIALLLARFAQDLAFYRMDTTASAYTIALEHTSDASLAAYAPLAFAYDGQQITLRQGPSIPDGCATLYGLSAFGTALLSAENMQNLDAGYLGSFAAVAPMQVFDITGDGIEENVYLSAKTDVIGIQSNASATPVFRDPLVMLEAGLYNARTLIVYYNTKPLSEREVLLRFADGTAKTYMTEADGRVEGVSIRQIRKGITVQYAPNAKNVYAVTYTPQTAKVFSVAMAPLIITALLASAAILAYLCVERVLYRQGTALSRAYGFASSPHALKKPASRFMALRWAVMLASFFALTWGGAMAGFWFENFTPPIFACARYNPEQLTGSACYYLSHLNLLKDLPLPNILLFLASFFVPLILFGRILCGFACPMGLVQDGMDKARGLTGARGLALDEKLYGRLRMVKWAFVMLFLGMGFAGLDFCNVCPVLTLSPGFSGFKASVYAGGFLCVFALVGSFFKRRAFCNICPLGMAMGLFYRLSLFRLKKDCTACTECGACYAACPMGIKSIYTEREKEDVTDANCIMCGECVRQCPEDGALAISFCAKKAYTSSREKFMSPYERKAKANG